MTREKQNAPAPRTGLSPDLKSAKLHSLPSDTGHIAQQHGNFEDQTSQVQIGLPLQALSPLFAFDSRIRNLEVLPHNPNSEPPHPKNPSKQVMPKEPNPARSARLYFT
jgi:hypothetical protein